MVEKCIIMTNSDLKNRVNLLKCFKRKKCKPLYLCKCDDVVIVALCELICGFLDQKFDIKNIKSIVKKLSKVKTNLRKLADPLLSIKKKRKILIKSCVQKRLYPILDGKLIPFLEGECKKVK